jgi:adenosylcobinamide-GDP ribazoletransferase
LMRQLLLAFQFLTIVPVKVPGKITDQDVAGSAAFFPLVGAFQGLATSISAVLLMKVFPADITAGLTLFFLILSNGGFDLDGLADTLDALAVKSSGDPENDRTRRLIVMKDSTTGAMGVVALSVTILLKFVLMRRLLSDFPILPAAVLLFLMPVFSKWINVPAMHHGVSARNNGLGRMFIEHAGRGCVLASTTIVISLCVIVASLGLMRVSPGTLLKFCLLLFAAFYLFCLLAVQFLTKRFGGLTGDHFGAVTEISEILFLLAGYVWLQHSIL